MSEDRPREQFATFAQQAEVANLGMWVFIATEIMFFGGVFGAYANYRLMFPQGFAHAAAHTEIWLGTANLFVLLISSLTMSLALANIGSPNRTGPLRFWLGVTMLLGLLFIVIKGIEYGEDYHEHLVPGLNFAPKEALGSGAELFFLLYFILTLLHALHMSIGICFVFYLWLRARNPAVVWRRRNLYENAGLYWSFVDVMWIFIYTAIYLPGRG